MKHFMKMNCGRFSKVKYIPTWALENCAVNEEWQPKVHIFLFLHISGSEHVLGSFGFVCQHGEYFLEKQLHQSLFFHWKNWEILFQVKNDKHYCKALPSMVWLKLQQTNGEQDAQRWFKVNCRHTHTHTHTLLVVSGCHGCCTTSGAIIGKLGSQVRSCSLCYKCAVILRL